MRRDDVSRSKLEVLINIYSHAEYVVFSVPERNIRIGEPCESARELLVQHGAASGVIITAWNPFSEERHPEENAAQNAKLLVEIETAGLRHLRAEGRDPNGVWAAEESYLVFDASNELVARWLLQFEQNAAVAITRTAPATLILHDRFNGG